MTTRHPAGTGVSRIPGRAAVSDSALLVVVMVLSCLPYLGGLGLYSDDWAFLSELQSARGSFRDMYGVLMPMGLTTRPVQALWLVTLYSLFGLEPLGYHVANCLVLAASAVLFYLSLRGLGAPRIIAFTTPLVFALLPHYSTDRVWIAAFQASVCVLLYFLSLYADLRFVDGTGVARWPWKVLGTVALVGSVLAYEVTAGLLLLNVVVLAYRARARAGRPVAHAWVPTALVVASNVLFLGLATAYKLSTTARASISGGYRLRALRIVREAIPVHFGEYGVALPSNVARVLRDPDALILATSVLVGLVVGSYLLRGVRRGEAAFPGRAVWVAVIIAGAALYVAGNAVALTTWEVGFHATGPNNRTAIGAAIGVATAFVGILGWLSAWLPADRARWMGFASLAAVLAAGSTLVTDTVAAFWVRAARRQDAVIAAVRQRFPELPPRTAVLLDGFCPYEGPAPVFATGWDVTGMLQLEYGERSLRGDVVKPNTEATADGIRTTLFDDVINIYPYGDRLVVYHVRGGRVVPIPDAGAARRYLDDVAEPERAPCRPWTDGDGIPVF